MKQWQLDRENPKNKEERDKVLQKNIQKKQKSNKKMNIAAMAKWHDLTLDQLSLKEKNG